MPRYNYMCEKVDLEQVQQEDFEAPEGYVLVNIGSETEPVPAWVWEERHGMTEDPEIVCKVCGERASRTMFGTSTTFYFPGNCYLDKSGCQRDMNLYKLQNHDPYGYMRQPGEKEELESKLKNAGKFGYDKSGNRKAKHFT